MRIFVLAGALMLGIVTTQAVTAKEFYKWVDDDGVTHYTVTAPKDRPSTRVHTRIGGSGDKSKTGAIPASRAMPGDETGSAPKARASQSAAQGQPVDPQRCEIAKSNISTLQNNARIRVTESDGSIRYLSEAERNEKMAEAEAAIRESCG
ncbi:DUF4124 domain-containing protein [Simiduia sp. 21SJ11W-1]|uniref:DUF4124 domain-containing protein n=1 Tax=Simiduia sp. 21SJ11W-1 TaxID=2909669 RepID=UPI00209CCB12|nr:DUF4124 domain-containing protein [Simiduia sp. 21SJ11W-1]UTA48845.1 DUF4124 domain-containing protein [Simiduia sp. 21SJ11W-1]